MLSENHKITYFMQFASGINMLMLCEHDCNLRHAVNNAISFNYKKWEVYRFHKDAADKLLNIQPHFKWIENQSNLLAY